jgi:hypothetical protein
MRYISASFLAFYAIALPACGPRLPTLDMVSQPAAPPAPDAGGDAAWRDTGLRATPPADAPTRSDAAPAEARPDLAPARPEAGPSETRPEVAASELRPDAPAIEPRPDSSTAETRPDAADERRADAVAEATVEAPPEVAAAPAARAPRAGELRIVEVMVDPDGNDLGHEWFEILNVAGEALSLADLHVADAATDVAVPAGVLAAGARLVLGQSLDRAHNGDAPVEVSYGTKLALNNDADRIAVCLGPCGDGVLLDDFPWSAPFGAAYAGHAVVIDYRTAANCPATEPYGAGGNFGTPGGPDPICPAPPLEPKLTRD